MRICFFGTPEPAVPGLRGLVDDPGIEVAAVVTNPDRPKGRGQKLAPPPVKIVAAEADVPVWQPEKPREIRDDLAALEVDACAIVAYGAILRRDVLDAGGAGFVNLHFSLLPAWRGAAPVPHAIVAGDRQTGVTCFLLDEGMDTGPVLGSARTQIGERETAGELTARLADLGAPVLREALRGLVDGSITPRPQPEEGVSYAPKLTTEDARLAWSEPADAIDRVVRAFNPVPGAHTTWQGERLKVHRVTLVAAPTGAATPAPGTVLGVDEPGEGLGGPIVACGEGTVRLDEVQPAGKPRMSGAAFARGVRLDGAVLGS
ncbi:methionyl-tRNA formyltransferase [Egibacter rhizosphaerae]|uniref:Methionyl-tRNA formyltransferase n=1 Tax=Egibacter rhizosphaerae TaxID=1670831 RepID=A0A411YK33_9ACTN|nr:methionyl-tRNA formyltransferase [Egibacter rhizosphaerae]QBI21547.1 methionyl-tRNA formyltransferase [Egibacter rhizosphaerae]